MSETTIFAARKIITMNPNRPTASHVAVREGRILGAGDLSELKGWGSYKLDETFADKILMPGLVEGHAHTMEGTLWRYVYCGYFDRSDPNGKQWDGVQTIEAIINRLSQAEALLDDPDTPLSGWSLDPIYMNNTRVSRADLDKVSSTRPIGVLHASGHILNVNTKALELGGLMKTGINHSGIPLGDDGFPTGELFGPETMTPVGVHVGFNRSLTDSDEQGLRDFAKLCVRTGVTTITDLAARLEEDGVEAMLRVTGEASYPARVVPLQIFMGATAKDTVDKVVGLKTRATDKLRLGRIKAVADGSIQGSRLGCVGRGITTERPTGCGIPPPNNWLNSTVWPL